MYSEKKRRGEVKYKGMICIRPPIWRIKENRMKNVIRENTNLSIMHSSEKISCLFNVYANSK
jgi:hypothetical protein